MPGFYNVNLPDFRAPGPLDFSGLKQSIAGLGEQFKENRLLQQQKDIGSAIQSGGYGDGADAAFAQGNLSLGTQLAGVEQADEDRDFNRNRLLASDKRTAAADARSTELHGLNVQKTQEDLRSSLISRTAGIAQRIRNETDPQRKSALVQSFVNAHPKLKTQLDAYGFDPANPDPTLDMIIAEAQGMTGPSAPIKVGNDLVQQGPDGQYVPVYRGQPKPGVPMNATSMREVFEADESAAASQNVLGSLKKALELNDQAYSGPAAQTRGYLTSLYGAEGGTATEDLQNVVTGQVLENLKATFGGMPTEGERQVLLDVQGSVSKSPEVRKRIFERAQVAAQRRLEFNMSKAEGIRSGAYFQPGYGAGTQAGPSPSPQAPQQTGAPVQVTTQQEYQALPPGTQYVAPDGSIRTKQ
jgi:hypothetical protein